MKYCNRIIIGLKIKKKFGEYFGLFSITITFGYSYKIDVIMLLFYARIEIIEQKNNRIGNPQFNFNDSIKIL